MPCEVIKFPDGGHGIICSRGPRTKPKPCVRCGEPSSQLCDWKVTNRKSGTCDRPLCQRCTFSPAEEKDLCPEHAATWKARGSQPDRLQAEPVQDDLFGGAT
jgi:hypothetical protein